MIFWAGGLAYEYKNKAQLSLIKRFVTYAPHLIPGGYLHLQSEEQFRFVDSLPSKQREDFWRAQREEVMRYQKWLESVDFDTGTHVYFSLLHLRMMEFFDDYFPPSGIAVARRAA